MRQEKLIAWLFKIPPTTKSGFPNALEHLIISSLWNALHTRLRPKRSYPARSIVKLISRTTTHLCPTLERRESDISETSPPVLPR